MPFLPRLRARARALLRRASHPVAPSSPRPADAIPGAAGTLAVHLLHLAPPSAPEPTWDRDPVTGEALPIGPSGEIPTVGLVAARALHRHGWLPALVHAGEAERAWALLDSWLRFDLPGHGVAWVHGTDAAVRLIHWHAALAGNPPAELVARMNGSASWHLRSLTARLPEAGHRRVAHLVGMIVGGFTFPAAPEARLAWSTGLSELRETFPALLASDGGDLDVAPEFLAQSVWLVAIARAVARANGSALPAEVESAWVGAVRYLAALAGDLGRLPALGDAPGIDILALNDYPIAWSLQNLMGAWGLDEAEGAPRGADDVRSALLGATPPRPPAPAVKPDLKATEEFRGARAKAMPAAPPRGWAMWTWRETGIVVAHLPIKGLPARATFAASGGRGEPMSHPAPLQVLYEVGEHELLADPGTAREAGELAEWIASTGAHNGLRDGDGELTLARVDGKKARMEGITGDWSRVALLNQQRLILTDRVTTTRRQRVRLTWQLGEGWDVKPGDKAWTLTRGPITVIAKLAEELQWSVVSGRAGSEPAGWIVRGGVVREAPAFVGEAEIDGPFEIESSFEVR